MCPLGSSPIRLVFALTAPTLRPVLNGGESPLHVHSILADLARQ